MVTTKKTNVTTSRGKNRDQYGRKFGKVQKHAMLEFTKSLWSQDAELSLRNMLKNDMGQACFMEFLKSEYNEEGLLFFLEAQKLDSMDSRDKFSVATKLYQEFLSSRANGIGKEERTESTQKLWDQVNNTTVDINNNQDIIGLLNKECDMILNTLAIDAFPRFIGSKYCAKVIEAMRSQGSNEMDQVVSNLNAAAPKDADEWLNSFVSLAESLPACIVISDMTIAGAPMVYVNEEFCNTTGYKREEATGRNCRFLQGPDTEPEAIQVIRSTLSKGLDCHVKLTNYRKNGEKFQNLLSMKPVFDADNIYRYVIGVQFEIRNDSTLKQRLIQLDKLLKLLPSKLPFKSKASSRAKGMLAVKTSGESNQLIQNKEYIEKQAKDMETQENMNTTSRPKQLNNNTDTKTTRVNYDKTIAAFTKIIWLSDLTNYFKAFLMDEDGRRCLKDYIEDSCSLLLKYHFEFFEDALKCRTTEGKNQLKNIRNVHMKMEKNAMFYCTTNEIDVGSLNQVNWGPIFQNMCQWHDQSVHVLADTFKNFLDTENFVKFISKLRSRELSGENLTIHTCAVHCDLNSPNMWLDMFKVMSESVSCGMVVSDMTVPGIPLAYINEGFKNVTGYGKDKIGSSCRFLQGKDTESYLNDEIMAALQQGEKLYIKLHNYKKTGEKFQCLFALHPVYDAENSNEYKYQIGLQIDFRESAEIVKQLQEMNHVLQYLPETISGELRSSHQDVSFAHKLVEEKPTLQSFGNQGLNSNDTGSEGMITSNNSGMGMNNNSGMGMNSGMNNNSDFTPQIPVGNPSSFTSPRLFG